MGLYFSKTAATAASRSFVTTDGSALLIGDQINSTQIFGNWHHTDSVSSQNSADFFKILFGEAGYDEVTMVMDVRGIQGDLAATSSDGGLIRLQAGVGGNNNVKCFTLFGRNASMVSYGPSMGGSKTSVDFSSDTTYHLTYVFNTKTHAITGTLQAIKADGTYDTEIELGTQSYQNIVDYINTQYTDLVGGTAKTLDEKVDALAEKNVFVSFFIGRELGKWQMKIDNYKLFTMVTPSSKEEIIPLATFDTAVTDATAAQTAIKNQTGLYISANAGKADVKTAVTITGGKLKVAGSEGILNWYTNTDGKDSSTFFKTIYGEGGYKNVVWEFDINAASNGGTNFQGGVIRMEMANSTASPSAHYCVLFGVTADGYMTFGGDKIGGDATGYAFTEGKDYHFKYEFDTVAYNVKLSVSEVNADGTYGKAEVVGTVSYKQMVDFINAESLRLLTDTAQLKSLDEMVKNLAKSTVDNKTHTSYIRFGRNSGSWTLLVDNMELYGIPG